MPEHIHVLTDEPLNGTLATFLQILKQLTSRELKPQAQDNFGNAATTISMSIPKKSEWGWIREEGATQPPFFR